MEQELKQYTDQLPGFMKDFGQIQAFVAKFKFSNNEQKYCVTNQLLFVLMGIKYFHFLPTYLITECNLDETMAMTIAQDFFETVIEPIKAEYLSMILKIYNNETDLTFDPEEAEVIKILFEDNEISIDSFKDQDIPVPKPPQFVSPKYSQAQEDSRIANIRPKPHQGTDDPYREAVDTDNGKPTIDD